MAYDIRAKLKSGGVDEFYQKTKINQETNVEKIKMEFCLFM